jgi:hypothetical protein
MLQKLVKIKGRLKKYLANSIILAEGIQAFKNWLQRAED